MARSTQVKRRSSAQGDVELLEAQLREVVLRLPKAYEKEIAQSERAAQAQGKKLQSLKARIAKLRARKKTTGRRDVRQGLGETIEALRVETATVKEALSERRRQGVALKAGRRRFKALQKALRVAEKGSRRSRRRRGSGAKEPLGGAELAATRRRGRRAATAPAPEAANSPAALEPSYALDT